MLKLLWFAFHWLVLPETGRSHMFIMFLVFFGRAQLFSYNMSGFFTVTEIQGIKLAANPPLNHV